MQAPTAAHVWSTPAEQLLRRTALRMHLPCCLHTLKGLQHGNNKPRLHIEMLLCR